MLVLLMGVGKSLIDWLMWGIGIDPIRGDPETRPVDLLLAELELGRVLQDAIVAQQG